MDSKIEPKKGVSRADGALPVSKKGVSRADGALPVSVTFSAKSGPFVGANYNKWIAFLTPEEQKKLLNYGSTFKAEMVLKKSWTEFANSIRRTLSDEIPIKTIWFELESIKSNDTFIVSDKIRIAIKSIPIKQKMDHGGIKVSLNVKNKTNQVIPVMSSDLVITDKKGNPIKICSQNIKIDVLRPNKSLILTNAYIKIGMGMDDGGAFSPTQAPEYDQLDYDPKRQSTDQNPSEFRIMYKTYHGSVEDPYYYFKLAFTSLILRLAKLKIAVDSVKSVPYISDTIDIKKLNGVFVFTLKQSKTQTLGRLIAREIYEGCPSINRSTAKYNYVIEQVRVYHDEGVEMFQHALEKLIQRYNMLLKSCK
jgi:hypothetical protein